MSKEQTPDPREDVERFEVPIEVGPEDIDELGHVNNVVYLRWVQEAATAHWRARADEEDQRSVLWVVRRHEIDYLRPAFADTEVLARTWVGPTEGTAFERHTELLRPRDGKVLARARTLWIPVDAETLRPTKVSEGVRERFSTPRS